MLTLIIIAAVIVFLGLALIGYLVANAWADIETAECSTRNIIRIAHSITMDADDVVWGDNYDYQY